MFKVTNGVFFGLLRTSRFKFQKLMAFIFKFKFHSKLFLTDLDLAESKIDTEVIRLNK